jgi:hypothetical protein
MAGGLGSERDPSSAIPFAGRVAGGESLRCDAVGERSEAADEVDKKAPELV